MADRTQGLMLREHFRKALGRWTERYLPEWQIFIRRPNGCADQYTFTRKRQLIAVGMGLTLAFWAGTATTLLTHRPFELAEKERRLDEAMAAAHAAQYRLSAAEKLVVDISREVESVHGNLQKLAESSDVLSKDRPIKTLARSKIAGDDKADSEDGEAMGAAEARIVRTRVRELEAGLARLQIAYGKAVQQVADSAGARISDTESRLSRLGLDPIRIFGGLKRNTDGQGGPFIPLHGNVTEDVGLSAMIDRIQHWIGVKAALQRLPLTEPVHAEHTFNSGFGTRNDPLNNRTGVHEGIDFGAPVGTPVYSTGEGIISFAGSKSRYGLTIDVDHGNGVTTRYAHLSRIKAQPGQKVTRSTIIGLVGNTGRSTGSHLHYEVRLNGTPKDPIKFISAGLDARKNR